MIEYTLRITDLNSEIDSDHDWPATAEDMMPIAQRDWDDDSWICVCGAENEGEFECLECGRPLETEEAFGF